MVDAIGSLFHLVDHPTPAAQTQEGRGQERIPIGLGDAKFAERFQNAFERFHRRISLAERCEFAVPALGSTAAGVELTESAKEASVLARQGRARHALIDERRSVPREQIAHREVGVGAAGTDQQVPQPCTFGLPLGIGHAAHGIRAASPEVGPVSGDPVFGDLPAQFRRCPCPRGQLHHRQLQIKSRHSGGDFDRSSGPEVRVQRRSQITGSNPPFGEFDTEAKLRQIGFAPEHSGRNLRRVLER